MYPLWIQAAIFDTQQILCVTDLGGHENTASTRISATGTLPSRDDGSDADATGSPSVSGSPSTAATELGGQSSASSAGKQSVPGPDECPRKALAGMLNNMMVLGTKTTDQEDDGDDSNDEETGKTKKKKPKGGKAKLPKKEPTPEVNCRALLI